jgi:hypothetical protein
MCEIKTSTGAACPNRSTFFAHVRVVPQRLADGSMERDRAGRSVCTCAAHLAQAVRRLLALPIRYPGVVPTVTTFTPPTREE